MTVRDFGRGIPLGKVVDCVSQDQHRREIQRRRLPVQRRPERRRHQGGQRAVEGVHRPQPSRGRIRRGRVQAGQAQEGEEGQGRKEPDGTFIEFEPDPEIFKEIEFRDGARRAPAAALQLSEHRAEARSTTARSSSRATACMDLVMEDLQADGSEPIYPPLHYASKTLEFCFTHSNSRYGETFLFVRQRPVHERRRHAPERLPRGLAQGGERISPTSKYEGDDVREGMVGAVAIRLKDPVFESQTKNKLGNTEIRTDLVNKVREELLHFFHRNKEIAEKIVAKVEDTAAAAEGIAGGEEAGARTRQGHHAAHPAAQGLQESLRQEAGTRARARWSSSDRRPVRRRLDRRAAAT